MTGGWVVVGLVIVGLNGHLAGRLVLHYLGLTPAIDISAIMPAVLVMDAVMRMTATNPVVICVYKCVVNRPLVAFSHISLIP